MNVCVVMATYNGGRFIEEQVRSIIGGDYPPDRLIIGDDISSDDTLLQAETLLREAGLPFDIVSHPTRLGTASNFLTMLRKVPADVDLVAFADQDDIWEPWKLQRALDWHEKQSSTPALYCSRQQLVDTVGQPLRLSPNFRRPTKFANALVENIASGCTVVINRPLINFANSFPIPTVTFHDWYLYLLTTGIDGTVFFDSHSGIRYRQHGGNVAGSPITPMANVRARVQRLSSKRSSEMIDENLMALQVVRPHLTSRNKQMFDNYVAARANGTAARLAYLLRSPLYRQTMIDTAIMRILMLSGRI